MQGGSRHTRGYKNKMNDGIIQFHPNDKFMQMNDGAILASTQEGQLHKAAKELSGGGDVNHTTYGAVPCPPGCWDHH